MTTLVMPLFARLRALFATTDWTCDQCHAVNSDSVTSCYKCGA